MDIHISTFATHKAGGDARDYEDASCVSYRHIREGRWSGPILRAAVADGASEAYLAGRWAELLAQNYVTYRGTLERAIDLAIDAWPELVRHYIAEREDRGKPIAWFEEPGLERGAYATILGCCLREEVSCSGTGSFDAWALGDACLFQIREDNLLQAFPIAESREFGYSPGLAPSKPTDRSAIGRHIVASHGEWSRGDTFYLVTDAMGHWFLRQAEQQLCPWRALGDLGTIDGPASFAEWIEGLRRDGLMHNDDCTVVRIGIV